MTNRSGMTKWEKWQLFGLMLRAAIISAFIIGFTIWAIQVIKQPTSIRCDGKVYKDSRGGQICATGFNSYN